MSNKLEKGGYQRSRSKAGISAKYSKNLPDPPKKHWEIGSRRTFRYFVRALTRALKAASFSRISFGKHKFVAHCALLTVYLLSPLGGKDH